jgi:hypothetical protein
VRTATEETMPTALHGQHGLVSVQTAGLITRIPTGLSGGSRNERIQ